MLYQQRHLQQQEPQEEQPHQVVVPVEVQAVETQE
jgi:hypothetical protein